LQSRPCLSSLESGGRLRELSCRLVMRRGRNGRVDHHDIE
jgi:hypothetical protein